MNTILLQDCIDGMKNLQDKSAQCVIIDPPYNIGKDYKTNTTKMTMDDYLNWCEKWLTESFRIVKDNGTVFIYGLSEILMHVGVRIESQFPDISIRWLVWHYTNKAVPRLNGWQRSHESILCCTRKNPIFNRDDIRVAYTDTFLKNSNGKSRKSTKGRFSKGEADTTYIAHPEGALPRDVIHCPALAGGAGKKERGGYETKHPTQKPLTLTETLLKSCKQEDGLVVVPFAGSGTECVVAKKLRLEFIGFELNQDYIDLANERLLT